MNDQKDSLFRIRHSLAHLLAQAVLEIRPGSKLGFGPPIEDGFYYDFLLTAPLAESDFAALEERMRRLIHENHPFIHEDLALKEAFLQIDERGESFKRQYAEELAVRERLESLRFYRTGSFVDMCEGPHVEMTSQLPVDAFKLRSIAGAYWRGDSKNVMMTRIYAWAFSSKEDLDHHLACVDLAKERDHKKLGHDLQIFIHDEDVGRGLPLWLPNGTIIRDELERLMKEIEFREGYQRVVTPHLAKAELFYKTGHLPYYAEHMYPLIEVPSGSGASESYCLKPMNCPHHHKIFASQLRSYRDLPLRLAEYGQVYRFEDSGALSGILRTRGFCQNDAHIYCSRDQAKGEFLKVMKMHEEVYKILGISSYSMRLSKWDPDDVKRAGKYVDDPESWEWAEGLIREAMIESGIPFVEAKGEAAFYGPKIDFQFKTVLGREETASTNQLDFGISARLDLSYIGSDGQKHHPVIIHRAPLGSHERFVAFLLEHYGGAFPTWLAPVQVEVLPVSEHQHEYGLQVVNHLRAHWIRAEISHSRESLGKRMRESIKRKIPNILVVGRREAESGSVTAKRYGCEGQKVMKFEEFTLSIQDKIRRRTS